MFEREGRNDLNDQEVETPIPLEPVSEAVRVRTARIEGVISAVLGYGVALSFAVLLIGSVLLFVEGGQSVTLNLTGAATPLGPLTVLAGVLQLQPVSIIDLGLLILIAIPVIHVGVSVAAFLVESDYIYAVIASFVLLVLLTSLLLGQAER